MEVTVLDNGNERYIKPELFTQIINNGTGARTVSIVDKDLCGNGGTTAFKNLMNEFDGLFIIAYPHVQHRISNVNGETEWIGRNAPIRGITANSDLRSIDMSGNIAKCTKAKILKSANEIIGYSKTIKGQVYILLDECHTIDKEEFEKIITALGDISYHIILLSATPTYSYDTDVLDVFNVLVNRYRIKNVRNPRKYVVRIHRATNKRQNGFIDTAFVDAVLNSNADRVLAFANNKDTIGLLLNETEPIFPFIGDTLSEAVGVPYNPIPANCVPDLERVVGSTSLAEGYDLWYKEPVSLYLNTKRLASAIGNINVYPTLYQFIERVRMGKEEIEMIKSVDVYIPFNDSQDNSGISPEGLKTYLESKKIITEIVDFVLPKTRKEWDGIPIEFDIILNEEGKTITTYAQRNRYKYWMKDIVSSVIRGFKNNDTPMSFDELVDIVVVQNNREFVYMHYWSNPMGLTWDEYRYEHGDSLVAEFRRVVNEARNLMAVDDNRIVSPILCYLSFFFWFKNKTFRKSLINGNVNYSKSNIRIFNYVALTSKNVRNYFIKYFNLVDIDISSAYPSILCIMLGCKPMDDFYSAITAVERFANMYDNSKTKEENRNEIKKEVNSIINDFRRDKEFLELCNFILDTQENKNGKGYMLSNIEMIHQEFGAYVTFGSIECCLIDGVTNIVYDGLRVHDGLLTELPIKSFKIEYGEHLLTFKSKYEGTDDWLSGLGTDLYMDGVLKVNLPIEFIGYNIKNDRNKTSKEAPSELTIDDFADPERSYLTIKSVMNNKVKLRWNDFYGYLPSKINQIVAGSFGHLGGDGRGNFRVPVIVNDNRVIVDESNYSDFDNSAF